MSRLRWCVLALLAMILLQTGVVHGGTLLNNEAIGDEELQYRVRFAERTDYATERFTYKRISLGSDKAYEINVESVTEEGERIKAEFKMLSPGFQPVSTHYVTMSKDGKNVLEDYRVEFQGDKIEFTATDGKKKTLNAPDNTYVGTVHILRGFPFAGKTKILLNVFYYRPGIAEYNVENKGIEKVKVPAGEFDCYRVETGATGISSMIIGKAQYWYSKDASHFLVKYVGKPQPFGAVQTSELVSRT